MTARYAEGTSVDVGRSRDEIERTLSRYGASAFAYGWENDRAAIGFTVSDRQVRMTIPLPARDDFTRTETGRSRTASSARDAYEAEVRRRWRALLLVVKAKLEAVESGVAEFETEWLGYLVLPGGRTVGEWAAPQLDKILASAKPPPLLAIEAPA